MPDYILVLAATGTASGVIGFIRIIFLEIRVSRLETKIREWELKQLREARGG